MDLLFTTVNMSKRLACKAGGLARSTYSRILNRPIPTPTQAQYSTSERISGAQLTVRFRDRSLFTAAAIGWQFHLLTPVASHAACALRWLSSDLATLNQALPI